LRWRNSCKQKNKQYLENGSTACQGGRFLSNSGLPGKEEIAQFRRDIIGRVALLIRYGIIRMAERRRVCGRWLAETGLSVGGVCLGAFGKYRDPSSEALATRSWSDFGTEIEWHVHCEWLPLLRWTIRVRFTAR
jgi:hypothetical protein